MTARERNRKLVDIQSLNTLIDRFEGTSVSIVGDLILDRYVWGKVERISPEAPVVVVQVTEENERLGGAGNVAHNLSTLGAKISVCGVIGDDEAGHATIKLVEGLGGKASGIIVDKSRKTTIKTRVIAHSQQVVRVDREMTDPLAANVGAALASAVAKELSQTKGVIVSDYAKGTITPEVFSVFDDGYRTGVLGKGKVPVLVDPKGPNFGLYSRATIVKPNRKEAEAAAGMAIIDRPSGIVAGRKLMERWGSEMILVTMGEMGMVLVGEEGVPEQNVEVETVAREVFDVSGAGDTVAAVFLLSLAAGGTPREAALLSNYAAGIVVAEVGTVAVTASELRAVVNEEIE